MLADAGDEGRLGVDATTITISGMSCGHCVAAVRKALAGVAGVEVQEVQIGTAVVGVDSPVTLAAATAAIEDAGYDVVTGRTLNVTTLPPQA
jgi:copper chaperone